MKELEAHKALKRLCVSRNLNSSHLFIRLLEGNVPLPARALPLPGLRRARLGPFAWLRQAASLSPAGRTRWAMPMAVAWRSALNKLSEASSALSSASTGRTAARHSELRQRT